MGLEVRDVCLALRVRGRERTLLHPLSLGVGPGEVVGVTGPSGAGKSTLLRIVVGLEARSGGEILLDGRPAEAEGLPAFRARVALVSQVAVAPPGTPLDIWHESGRFRSRRGRSRDAADLVGEAAALGLPEDALERPFRELSEGQRRRVHVALALAGRPDHLLLDEPSEGLDRRATSLLADRLAALRDGCTGVVLATHSEALLARLCDRILVLYDGSLQVEGPPLEVIPGAVDALRRGGA